MAQPVVHFEIIGKEPAKLRSYFGDLFGWEFDTSSPVAEAVSEPDCWPLRVASCSPATVAAILWRSIQGMGTRSGIHASEIFPMRRRRICSMESSTCSLRWETLCTIF